MPEIHTSDAPVPELSRSVRGSTVLITGAASGMGRSTAFVFAREGANVAVTDIDAAGVKAVVEGIVKEGGTARGWTMDVASEADIERVVAEIGAHFGGLDIIVNNAGISRPVPLDDPAYEQNWGRHIDILLSAHQRIIRAGLPLLRRSGAARIINIASTEALGASRGFSAYSAAKAGVAGLTRSLAVELGREQITVNCICPGPIHTGMTREVDDKAKQTFADRRTSLRRYGDPAEVAHITLSLALPAASYLTGTVIPVDGGLMARNA